MNNKDSKLKSQETEDDFFSQCQKLADDRSALEDKLSTCRPEWVHIYRSFVGRMNRASLEKGLVAYTDTIGSYSDAYRFQHFQDISITMSDLQQELRDIQQAAAEISRRLKIANENNNEQDIQKTEHIDIAVRHQLGYTYDNIIRKEKEILDIFWKGKRPF